MYIVEIMTEITTGDRYILGYHRIHGSEFGVGTDLTQEHESIRKQSIGRPDGVYSLELHQQIPHTNTITAQPFMSTPYVYWQGVQYESLETVKAFQAIESTNV